VTQMTTSTALGSKASTLNDMLRTIFAGFGVVVVLVTVVLFFGDMRSRLNALERDIVVLRSQIVDANTSSAALLIEFREFRAEIRERLKKP
jgi:hypothetical protein